MFDPKKNIHDAIKNFLSHARLQARSGHERERFHEFLTLPWNYSNEELQKRGQYPCDIGHLRFKLTEKSKELFMQGNDFQGYIGVADLLSGAVHLFPCFNFPEDKMNDLMNASGLTEKQLSLPSTVELREEAAEKIYFQFLKNVCNRNNESFTHNNSTENCIVKVANPIGTNTGRAHEVALECAGLQNVNRNTLIGFGIFKGKDDLIFEFRDRSANLNYNSIIYSDALMGYLQEEKLIGILKAKMKRERRRALPQEMGDLLLKTLLEELPLGPNQSRTLTKDARSRKYDYPLYTAALNGDLSLVTKLIESHFNVNEIATINRESCFRAALKSKNKEVIEFFLENEKLDLSEDDLNYSLNYLYQAEWFVPFINLLNVGFKNPQTRDLLGQTPKIMSIIYSFIRDYDNDLLILYEAVLGVRDLDDMLDMRGLNIIHDNQKATDFNSLYKNAVECNRQIENLIDYLRADELISVGLTHNEMRRMVKESDEFLEKIFDELNTEINRPKRGFRRDF